MAAEPCPELFKELRARFGLSQAAAGELFDVGQTIWSAWERDGKPTAAARMMARLLLAKPELIDLFMEKPEHVVPAATE